MNEEEYKKELAANGVEIPEVKKEETPESPKEKPEEKKIEKPEAPKEETPEEPLQEPREPRKRSIYDEYKDKKLEVKNERELREKAERERDEFRIKYETLEKANTPEERQEAKDDIEAFAKEINADPQVIKKMREVFLKDVKPQTDESIKKDLEEFKAWKQNNSQVIEKQLFEEEFVRTVPTIKRLFPQATEEELNAIKKEVDSVSHTKEWHDKDLDYVVFKNQDKLQALVSPKKRGMEIKNRKDVSEIAFEFDPNADYSKMSMKEREQWEEAYKKATKAEGLLEDSQGRKIIL